MMLIRALIRQDNERLPSEKVPIKYDRPQGRTSLLWEEAKPLLLSTLGIESCDAPEGFNTGIPMFVLGVRQVLQGGYCRCWFSSQLSIFCLFRPVHSFHYGGFGTGSHCSCSNMVGVRGWNRLDGAAHLHQWLHYSALES